MQTRRTGMSSGHHPRTISSPTTAIANDSTSSTPSREYQTRLKRIYALLEDPASASSTAEGEEGGLRASRRLLAKSPSLSSARTIVGGLRGPRTPGHGSAGATTRRAINDSGTPTSTHAPNKRRKTVDEIVSEMGRLNAVKKELARKGLLGGRGRGSSSVVDESSSRSGNTRNGTGTTMKTIAKPISTSTTNGATNGSANGTLRQVPTVPVQVQGPPPPPSPSTSDDAVHVPPMPAPSLNLSASTTARRTSARLVASATASSLCRDTAQQPSTPARSNARTRPVVAQSISYPPRLRSSRNSQTRREQRQLPSIVKKKRTESSSRAHKKHTSTTTTAAIATSLTTASVQISGGKLIVSGGRATEPFKRTTVADELPAESEEATTRVAMADLPNQQHPSRRDVMSAPQDLNPVRPMSAPTTDQHIVPSISHPIPLAAGPGPRSLVPTTSVDNCPPQPFIIDPNPNPTTSTTATTTLNASEPTNQTTLLNLVDDFDLPLNPPELPPSQINTRLLPANQTYPEDAQIPHNFLNPPIYHDFVVQRTRPALPAVHSPMTSEDEDEKRYWKRKAKRAKGVNRTFYKSLRRGRGGGGGGGVGLTVGVPVGSESIPSSGSGSGAMFLSASSTSGSGSSSSRGPDFNAWADELLKVLRPRIIDIVDEAVEAAFMKRSRSAGAPWGMGATSLPFEEEEEEEEEEESEDKNLMEQEQGRDQPMQGHDEHDQVGAQPPVILDTQLLERDRPRSPDVAHQASLEPDLPGRVEGNVTAHPHTASSPGQLRPSASPPPRHSIPPATPPPPQNLGSRIPLLGNSPANTRPKAQPPSRIAAAPGPAPIPGIPSASEPTRIKVDPDMVEAMQREHERLLANLRPLLTRDPTPMSEDEDEFEEPMKALGSAGHEDLDADADANPDADADADAEGESDNGDAIAYVGATVAVEDVPVNRNAAHRDGASNVPVGMDLDHHRPGLEASELPMDVTLDGDGQGNNNSTSTSTLNGQPNAPPFMHH